MSSGRLTNASKSVYSFEGEVLSEEEDEYKSDTSFEEEPKDNGPVYQMNFVEQDEYMIHHELPNQCDQNLADQFSSVSGLEYQRQIGYIDHYQVPVPEPSKIGAMDQTIKFAYEDEIMSCEPQCAFHSQ